METTTQMKQATYHLYTFIVSKVVAALGASVYGFAMSLYILTMTGSALSFAGNMLSSIVPRIILSPLAGTLADRIPRKRLVIGGQIGEIAVLVSLLAYMSVNGLSVTAIYIATACYTVFSTFSSISLSASIPNLIDQDRIQQAMSYNQMATSSASILGPIVGGMLFGLLSIHWFLVVNIAALVITTILLATMNFQLFTKLVEKSANVSVVSELQQGLQYVNQHLLIKRLLLTIVWLNLFFMSIAVGAGFISLELLQMKPEHLGLVEAGSAVGMLLMSLRFAHKKPLTNPIMYARNAILGSSILVGIFALPLLISMPYVVMISFYLLLMLLFGALNVMTNMPLMLLFQTRVEEQYRGRVFGLIDMVAMGFMPIGTLVYGVLYDVFPAAVILFMSSLMLVIVTIWTLTSKVVAAERATAPQG